MAKKTRVAVIFGGRSGEHEVSLVSAASVIKAIDKKKYEVIPVGVTKQGGWLNPADSEKLLVGKLGAKAKTQPAETALAKASADVIFPVLHGTFGEDGATQGLLELLDVAYVGSGVLASSTGMDKDAAKRIFRDAGLAQVPSLTVLRSEWEATPKKIIAAVKKALSFPVFVKPANLGSSVGISKAHDAKELVGAITEAAKFDRKIVIEQGVGGAKKAREIECAMLGNDAPAASICGEIVPEKEFYDYDAKYVDDRSQLLIPAPITKAQQKKLQQLAIDAFRALDLAGLARVDFLVDPNDGSIWLNEVNTIPGFTSISMYPKLWAASGVDYTTLITRLLDLALERHAEKQRNRYSK